MLEKRGVIDENTPAEVPSECSQPSCGCHARAAKVAAQKQAADPHEDHPTTRAADAVKDQTKR